MIQIFLKLWDYVFFIVFFCCLLFILFFGVVGTVNWWNSINYDYNHQECEIHDRLATPEELEYYKQLEAERKRQEELKANPPRAVIEEASVNNIWPSDQHNPNGLQLSAGVFHNIKWDEKWYGSHTSRHYRTDEWQPDVDHFYRDADDYYIIAANNSIVPMNGVLQTSKGPAKRYDTCETPGVVDFYVDR